MYRSRIQRLTHIEDRHIDELVKVLRDCVEGGASVGFMQPLSVQRAQTFWRQIADGVARGERAVLVAVDDIGIAGTVQLVLAQPDNQPHRADLAKMLVHRRARRRGLGAELLRAAEDLAREHGKTLLVLDTVTEAAGDRLYTRGGWKRVGEIPGFALYPQGGLCPTTLFYKALS